MNTQKLNNLLKDPNTNWKYILIVTILGFLVGGGILGYQYWWLPKQEVEMPEIEIPERKVTDETANWKTYSNEEYGFEVKYPPERTVTESALEIVPGKWISFAGISIYMSPKFVNIRAEAGGPLYLDAPPEDFAGNILLEDVTINGIPFQKDYYVGYAGMGSFTSGINAFTKSKHKGNYIVISVSHGRLEARVPDELQDTEECQKGSWQSCVLTPESIQWLAEKMKEGELENTKIFHKMLSTFRFLEE